MKSKYFVASVVVLYMWTWGALYGVKAQQTNLPPEVINFADTVLYNGKVLTADDQFTIVEAVAIRDDELMAVGTTDRILKMAGPQTRKIDLKGRTVVPGFIDTHQHMPDHATRDYFMVRDDVQWEGKIEPSGYVLIFESVEHVLRNIKKIVAVTPPGEWVVLYGSTDTIRHWVMPIRRSQLDAISPSNPVAIMAQAGSVAGVNSLALTKIPKTMRGYPQGDEVWIEGPAGQMIMLDVHWTMPQDKLMATLKEKMLDLNANSGFTCLGTRIYPHELTAIRELWSKGELTMRFRLNADNFMSGSENLEMAFRRMGNISDLGDDWIRISGMGGGAGDSSGQSGGAWTYARRLQDTTSVHPGMVIQYGPHGTRGLEDRWDGKERLVQLTRYGWSVANTHSVGDRSTAVFLDAYEEALSQGPAVRSHSQRLTLDHLLMVRPEDILRFKKLGVHPSIAPWFLFMPPNTTILAELYGEDVVNQMMPVKSYITAGIKPGLEADVDGRPYRDPLWIMEKVITRKDEKGRVWNPSEKVSRQEALWMYTNWSAYQRGDENKLGSLEPGKLADMVVLDRDYMTVPEDEISKIPLVMTIVGGKIVFEKPGMF